MTVSVTLGTPLFRGRSLSHRSQGILEKDQSAVKEIDGRRRYQIVEAKICVLSSPCLL
jgi:hypothetical protein